MHAPTHKTSSFSPWPWAILLFFIGLAIFNVFLYWIANDAPHQLVAEDYYSEAVDYNQIIDARQLSENQTWQLELSHRFEQETSVFTISPVTPDDSALSATTGTLHLYRPANKALDRHVELQGQLSEGFEAQLSALPSGLWEATVLFQNEEKIPLFYQKFRLHL